MIRNVHVQAVPPSALSTPVRRASHAVGPDSPNAGRLRFEDALAASKPGPVLSATGNARADQMWEAKPASGRERRKQERLERYRNSVDQQSATQVNERTGVDARRALSAGLRPPAIETQSPSPRNTAESRSEEAPPPSASTVSPRGEEPHLESKPENRLQTRTMTATRTTSDKGTGDRSNAQPPSSSARPAPVRESTPVVGSGLRVSSDGPQAAKEVARMLATNSASLQRDIPTVAAGSGNNRAGNSSAHEKTKNDTKEATNSGMEPRAEANTEGGAKVSEFEKLVRLVRASSGKHSTARMMLDPPQLGKVHVRVVVEGDRVDIGVETEHDAARQIIARRAATLISVLEENGFQVDRFDVAVNQAGLFDSHPATGVNRPTFQEQPGNKSEREGNGRSRRTADTNHLGKGITVQLPRGTDRGFDVEV